MSIIGKKAVMDFLISIPYFPTPHKGDVDGNRTEGSA